MKKNIMYILLLITVLLVLTGCNNTLTKNESNYTNEKANVSLKDYTPPIISPSVEHNTSTSSINKTMSKEVITSFFTKIYDTKEGRMNNLRVASEKLSNTKIKSGETFSFNDIMGPSNKENGYQKAKIFDSKGNVLEEYGGGICQISSTLYNAALNLNLEIIERSNHSKKVQYVEPGKDAAISYGHHDLKFKNTLNYDIIIQCRIENNKVIVDIEKEVSS